VKKSILGAVLIVLGTAWSFGLTIYPIDRAEILAGARFDFKVELDGVVAEKDVSVTVIRAGTAADYVKVFGKKADFVEKEKIGEKDKAAEASALMLRGLTLAKPGDYMVSVTDGKTTRSVSWTVYSPAAKAVARNIIFLLGDGLSMGHTTAARILSKGITEGKSNALMNYDLMDRVGMVRTSSVDSIAVDSANSMSAYMTGHKSSVNAIGVYADRTPDPF
jgi:alkaline phosphatase